jgi:hypothetical protein
MLTCGIWWRRTAQSPGRYSCWLCVITLVSWDILLQARVQFLAQQNFFLVVVGDQLKKSY